jgi:hypothetical protein
MERSNQLYSSNVFGGLGVFMVGFPGPGGHQNLHKKVFLFWKHCLIRHTMPGMYHWLVGYAGVQFHLLY